MKRLVPANIKDPALVIERRDRIIRAAISVILRKGYHAATVRDIGREARLTQGTIYNYVRSKGDILYLVCDQLVGRYQEAVRRAIEGIGDPSTRLGEALRAVIEIMHTHQEDLLLLYRESHALDRKSLHALLARVGEFIEFFEHILSAARENGHAGIGNLNLAANIVTFLPAIVALRRWDLRRKVPKDEMIRGLVDFMMRGLGAKEGALSSAPTAAAGPSRSSPSSRARVGAP